MLEMNTDSTISINLIEIVAKIREVQLKMQRIKELVLNTAATVRAKTTTKTINPTKNSEGKVH